MNNDAAVAISGDETNSRLVALQRDTIVSLEQAIKVLCKNLLERQEWLANNNTLQVCVKPKFSNTYTKRSLTARDTTDAKCDKRLAAAERAAELRNLSSKSKQLITALKAQCQERMEMHREELTAAFDYDIETRPMYQQLSKKDMEDIVSDLEQQLTKDEARLKHELTIEIERVIAQDKNRRVRVRKTMSEPLPAPIVKIKDDNAKLYRGLVEQLNAEEAVAKAAFEEVVKKFIAQGYSDYDILLVRKDNEQQMAKDRAARIKEFDASASRRTRLAQAELLSENVDEKVNELVAVYTNQVKDKVLGSRTITWNKMIIDLDLGFVQSLYQWDIFCTYLVSCWLALADTTRQDEYERLVYLYAVLTLHQQDNCEPVDPEIPGITNLRAQRNELLVKVKTLDETIRQRVKACPKPAKLRTTPTKRANKNAELYRRYTLEPVAIKPLTKEELTDKEAIVDEADSYQQMEIQLQKEARKQMVQRQIEIDWATRK